VKQSSGKSDGTGKGGVEARDQKAVIEDRQKDNSQSEHDCHEHDVPGSKSGSLTEEEFVDATLASGGEALNHRDKADSHGEKCREDEAER
jgi:hypothetical protein